MFVKLYVAAALVLDIAASLTKYVTMLANVALTRFVNLSVVIVIIILVEEAHSESCQTCKMECLEK